MKNNTKQLFAKTLEEMLLTTPFDKIRITTLCKNCNAAPQTFYNHFRDKYDLVAWMFEQDFQKGICGFHKYSSEVVLKVTKELLKHKSFYQKVYRDHSQNSINNYIYEFNIRLATEQIKKHFHQDKLTTSLLIAVKYHIYGTMALFKELLYDDLNVSLEKLSEFEYQKTPDFLKEVLI
ncbi:MAG TPA: TetR/AcrR family transcriptional regulator C-terminal domain-containing protein [Candidatus Limosilactobacillus excrementigallinarum]|nr:TetR/AcrR family transcriptional regulator C-terminal domain-containing protein [Candidatus Limosilactobacillus excrementigallinarum]